MRTVLSILLFPVLVVVLGFTLVALVPVGGAHAAPATDTLPACAYEDGSGQVLCMWDASEQGNGIGTDVVAGDCSVGTVGTQAASAACVQLWSMGERTTYLADGAVSVTSKGSVLVDDCLTIEWQASIDGEVRKALENEGWTLEECFKAHM